jgi:tRNA-2-methylthio-N6-dimethylallyladenosine synthase
LVEQVGFASAYAFKYSERPGTPAAEAQDQVPEAVKEQRHARLFALLERQRQAFNHATVGRRFGVMFDKPGRHEGQLGGRSPYMQAVHVEAPAELLGRMAQVEIVAVGPNSLKGRLVGGRTY